MNKPTFEGFPQAGKLRNPDNSYTEIGNECDEDVRAALDKIYAKYITELHPDDIFQVINSSAHIASVFALMRISSSGLKTKL